MPVVTYIQDDGSQQDIYVENGSSLMRGALDNLLDGILGECGGNRSCATCHCYVDPAWLDKVAPPSELEKELLACVLNPQENSRLSCQIRLTDELDGLVVTLPKSHI